MHPLESTSMAPADKLSRRRLLQLAGLGYGAALFGTSRGLWAAEETTADSQPFAPLLTRSIDPPNAEPTLANLVQDWITPVEQFYIRSHATAPQVNEDNFTLTISGLVHKPLVLKVKELAARFPEQTVTATMTCAGNRRAEYNAIKPVGGVQWTSGAIGNAKWTGVLLSAVLKAAGLQGDAKHIWFEGADDISHGGETIHFGGSIPVSKAMTNTAQMPGALLVSKMNGEPLTPDHGFPLRSVVPGYIGARSVKWLNRIVVSNEPSPNHYLAGAYKLVTDNEPSSWNSAPALYEYLPNSVICTPAPDARVKSGKISLTGYALPSGKPDCTVQKLEVSSDGGKTWLSAKLGEKSQAYCWRLWNAEIPVSAGTKQLLSRVTDSTGAQQPAKVDWNLKGYMNNSWYRTPVTVEN